MTLNLLVDVAKERLIGSVEDNKKSMKMAKQYNDNGDWNSTYPHIIRIEHGEIKIIPPPTTEKTP